MFYIDINSEEFRKFRNMLWYFLIVTNLSMYSSCTSSETLYLIPDTQDSGMLKDITRIKLNDGKFIYCKDNLIKLEKSSDTTGFALIQTLDTIIAGSNSYVYKTSWNELRIPLNDIQNFQIYETKGNDGMTIGIIVGFVTIVCLIVLAASAPLF